MGVLPYISHFGMCRPKGKGFFCRFGLMAGINFAQFFSRIGCGCQGNYGSVRTYLLFQFQMSKKETEICEFEMDFRNLFCCCSYLSIDAIISLRLGLKKGMDFTGQV